MRVAAALSEAEVQLRPVMPWLAEVRMRPAPGGAPDRIRLGLSGEPPLSRPVSVRPEAPAKRFVPEEALPSWARRQSAFVVFLPSPSVQPQATSAIPVRLRLSGEPTLSRPAPVRPEAPAKRFAPEEALPSWARRQSAFVVFLPSPSVQSQATSAIPVAPPPSQQTRGRTALAAVRTRLVPPPAFSS